MKAERAARIHNTNQDRQYNQKLNKFSMMTKKEKAQYLGLQNVTLTDDVTSSSIDDPELLSSKAQLMETNNVPDEFNHRDLGHVTSVKDQGGCGSCWAFAAAGAFEGSYSTVTKVLKSFSAKELLDCTYPAEKNGCKGGFYDKAWNYIEKSGRLASEREIPYFPGQDECGTWDGKPNGIRNAQYLAHYRSNKLHENVKNIIRSYTPAVAFTVEDDFYGYEVGHYDGCPTYKRLNHGIILVGYGPDYWEAKNSWGSDWGNKGFVKFTRAKADVCRILSYVMYPVVLKKDRGEVDEPDVIPDEDLTDNIAQGKQVTSSDGGDVVTAAVDGDEATCYTTSQKYNPYIKINFGKEYRVLRVEITTDTSSGLLDGKVHIGDRGNFVDERISKIEEVEDGKVVIRLDEPVKGSWLYLEIYTNGERFLSVCEIKVFAAPSKEDDSTCTSGTTLCADGVCRHTHMC